jgi:hypothetical protein
MAEGMNLDRLVFYLEVTGNNPTIEIQFLCDGFHLFHVIGTTRLQTNMSKITSVGIHSEVMKKRLLGGIITHIADSPACMLILLQDEPIVVLLFLSWVVVQPPAGQGTQWSLALYMGNPALCPGTVNGIGKVPISHREKGIGVPSVYLGVHLLDQSLSLYRHARPPSVSVRGAKYGRSFGVLFGLW